MPYISGLNNKDGKLIIINESDWSVEVAEDISASPDTGYEKTVVSGTKLVAFRRTTGEIEAYGNVTPSETSISGSPEEPGGDQGTWYDVFDNTYWESQQATTGEGFFDLCAFNTETQVWTPTEDLAPASRRVWLLPKSGTSWATGFYPTKMRIRLGSATTGASASDYIELRDHPDAGFLIGQAVMRGYENDQEITLTFNTGEGNTDLASLLIPAIDLAQTSYDVTAIQFDAYPGVGGTPTFTDNFNNDYYWAETDIAGVGSFTNGRYEVTGYGDGSIIILGSSSKWRTGGQFEMIFEFDIDSISGTPDWTSYASITLTENEVKAATWGILLFRGNNDGTFGWDMNWFGTLEGAWGSFTTGHYMVKIRRNANNSITVWVWNNGQWEWNGNTAGNTSPQTTFDQEIFWDLKTSIYSAGEDFAMGWDRVQQTAGTFTDLMA